MCKHRQYLLLVAACWCQGTFWLVASASAQVVLRSQAGQQPWDGSPSAPCKDDGVMMAACAVVYVMM